MSKSPLVLIVEPNPFMAEVQKATLRGFDVQFVSPDDLVEAVSTRRPALAITEIVLKGRDGLQLCRTLKRGPLTAATPVLVFSVLDAKCEAYEAGADSFLLKPAGRGELAGEARRLTGQPPPLEPWRSRVLDSGRQL